MSIAWPDTPRDAPEMRSSMNLRSTGMPRDVDMQDVSPIVGKDDEDQQDPAGKRGHGEEVDGDGGAEMVLEERPPRLRRWRSPTRHQPRDRPLRNCEPQLQQFPMDPRRAPQRVLGGHIPDEAPHVSGDLRAASVRTRPPGPVPGEAAAVPADDRRGSDDHQGRLPVRRCPSQSEPEQPIGRTHGGLRASALVHS